MTDSPLTPEEIDIIKTRAADEFKLAMHPNDTVVLKEVTQAWFKRIEKYKATKPEMAKFVQNQFVQLLEIGKEERIKSLSEQERDVCNRMADELSFGKTSLVTDKGIDYYLNQCLPKRLVSKTFLGIEI